MLGWPALAAGTAVTLLCFGLLSPVAPPACHHALTTVRCQPLVCSTRNPGNNPSTSWAGLFTFSGGKLTSDPQGNGVVSQGFAGALTPAAGATVMHMPADAAACLQSFLQLKAPSHTDFHVCGNLLQAKQLSKDKWTGEQWTFT